ncbi:DUF1552 domain-containing protein [Schlesneria paludicola]|uniref:DUF1552 domain-containing protein n=1 Tax=Schlesneria paludicola TaxID=360056 RepID=UPI00029ABF02
MQRDTLSDQPKLPRRLFLKGTGVTLGLPLLNGMMPSNGWAAGATNAPTRMAFVFVPNGVVIPDWKPTSDGTDWQLSPTLQSLENVKDRLCVMSGLAQDNAHPKGDGPGDHARSAAAFLTGAHPVKTDGADIRAGISIDQVAAERIGAMTKLPSLEIGTEGGRNAGQCDSGYSCAYSNNISWKTPTTPMSKEINPKLVFERLFGSARDRESVKNQQKRDFYRKSILDAVGDDAAKLSTKLGQTDRRKLDEYFTSVREIEVRIARSRADQTEQKVPQIALPTSVPKDLDEHIRLMFDLLALAFETDTTRVATFMLANEGSNRSYPMVGVNDGHHHLSHHQKKEDWLAGLRKIDAYLVSHFARFLERLKNTPEGDGSILDHSMIVYGSAISDGDAHNHNELPILLAGTGSGSIVANRHLVYPENTPMNNLFLSMLDRMGVGEGIEQIGDSTGRLDRLTA